FLALFSTQRLELDRGRTNAPPAPARTDVEQLGAGKADDQERRIPHPLGEMLDQVEERVLGPVDVLESEYERLVVGHPLDPFAREPALTDARVTVDREQMRAAVSDGAFVGVLQELELGLASDQRRRDPAARRCSVENRLSPPSPNPVAEALDVERTDVLGLYPSAR